MWTAKLQDVCIEEGHFNVLYSDGAKRSLTKRYFQLPTDANVKAASIAEVNRLEAADLAVTALTLKVGSAVDLTPPVAVAAKVDLSAQARSDWFDQYRQLQSLQRAASAGFIDPADKRIGVLQALLKAAWSDSYLDSM